MRIDLQAVKEIEHLDDTLSTEDVALGYKQLLKVESAFRSLKQTIELAPYTTVKMSGSEHMCCCVGCPCY